MDLQLRELSMLSGQRTSLESKNTAKQIMSIRVEAQSRIAPSNDHKDHGSFGL